MQKDEFIKIVNALIDARIKKMVPALVEKKVAQLKKEMIEGTIGVPDEVEIPDLNLNSALNEDSILPKRKPLVASKPIAKPAPITKTFTKDSTLNAILQQTAEEIRSGKIKPAQDADTMQQYKQLLTEQYNQAAASGEDMETFQFNMNDIPAIASKRAMTPPTSNAMQSEIEKKIALEVEKKQIEQMTGNPELGGIIMRDYRSLMKAVDEKTKSKRV